MKTNKTTPTIKNMCLVVIGAPHEIAAFSLEAAKTLPFLKFCPQSGEFLDPEPKCDPMEMRHRKAESEAMQCWEFDWKASSKYVGEERPDILAYELDAAGSPPISQFKQLSKIHPRLFFHISSVTVKSAQGVIQRGEHFFYNGLSREGSRSTPIIKLPDNLTDSEVWKIAADSLGLS